MNIVIALLGSLLICGLLIIARHWIIMRFHAAFTVSIIEGDYEEADYYYSCLLTWCPTQLGHNPAFMLAAVDVRLLTSSLPKERLLEYFDKLAREGIAKIPSSPYPYLLAAGLASQRDPGCELCRNYLSQAIAAANRDILIYRHAGEIQLAAGMYRESARYFSLLRNIAIIHRDSEAIASATLALARLYAQIEAAPTLADSKAIKYIDAFLENCEDDTERIKVSILKANEYARYHKYNRAAEVLYEAYGNTALENKKMAMEMLVHPLTTTLLSNGDPDSAEKIVDTALSMGIAYLEVERASIAYHRQQPDQASAFLKQAVANHGGAVAQMLKIALAFKQFGNLTMAVALLEQIAKSPVKFGSAYSEANAANAAIAHLYSATFLHELAVNDTAFFPFEPCSFGLRSASSELADCYCRLQRYEDAAAEWRKAVRRHPHNPVYQVHLANALCLAKRDREAAQLYRQAEKRLLSLVEEAPSCPVFHCALGDIYHHDGDEILAAFHYKMVICEPYQEHTSKVLHTIKIDADKMEELVNRRVLEQADDSDARSSLAMKLAVHGFAAQAERERPGNLEAKTQTP